MANMNNQGRTPKQYKDSARFAWYGVIGMTILLILMTLLSSCSITKETPTYKCELMQKGQKCLPDHSCCKK